MATVWRRAPRTRSALSLLFVDNIDRFKAYNDTYGHQAGDKFVVVLKKAPFSATVCR
ncbi:protein of unknown function (plasmid) [Caballeronia sp. S22]